MLKKYFLYLQTEKEKTYVESEKANNHTLEQFQHILTYNPKSGKDSMDVLEQQLNQLALMTVLCLE